MSALGVERGARAVKERNIGLLASVSGIGKKTAERLALELADKLGEFEDAASATTPAGGGGGGSGGGGAGAAALRAPGRPGPGPAGPDRAVGQAPGAAGGAPGGRARRACDAR